MPQNSLYSARQSLNHGHSPAPQEMQPPDKAAPTTYPLINPPSLEGVRFLVPQGKRLNVYINLATKINKITIIILLDVKNVSVRINNWPWLSYWTQVMVKNDKSNAN